MRQSCSLELFLSCCVGLNGTNITSRLFINSVSVQHFIHPSLHPSILLSSQQVSTNGLRPKHIFDHPGISGQLWQVCPLSPESKQNIGICFMNHISGTNPESLRPPATPSPLQVKTFLFGGGRTPQTHNRTSDDESWLLRRPASLVSLAKSCTQHEQLQ